MGKAMLMIVAGLGFTISTGLVNQQNRINEQTQQVVTHYSEQVAENLASSGMNLALSRIKRDFDWRGGYSQTSGSGGSFDVNICDLDTVIRIISTGHVNNCNKSVQVDLRLTREASAYAIYSTADVNNVFPLSQERHIDSTLLIKHADAMPDLELVPFILMACEQGHFYGDPRTDFKPYNGYPNSSFYRDGVDPNVTYVRGDMKVLGGVNVYGIFLVEKDIYIYGSARIEGVLYLLNPTAKVYYDVTVCGGGSPDESSVVGGVLANGNISATGSHVSVQYEPEYMNYFGELGNSPPMLKILRWKT